jgi:tetratricopeptide (TPR) repeat protein
MSGTNAENNGAGSRYSSLVSLQEAHMSLLKQYREGATEEVLNQVDAFIRKARDTGAILDGDTDRYASQTMLDYWVTILFSARRTPPDGVLADFDPLLSPILDDSLCPYLGLNAFQEEHTENFYGRQRLIQHLLEKIKKTTLLCLVGQSGSGKSSAVFAGLIPALKKGALPESERWRYVPPIVPGHNPLRSLALAVNTILGEPEESVSQQVDQLKEDSGYLLKKIEGRLKEPVVIVIDQFEELYTLCNDDQEREAFVNSLVALAESVARRHLVILTLRTDFENLLAQSPSLLPLFEKGQVLVTPLTAADLRAAIEEPAKRVGLRFEEGVVDAMVKDILGEQEGLPLLQFTLLRLWKMREGGRNRITLKQYRQLGDARRALALTADEFYKSLTPAKQNRVKRIMLRLSLPTHNAEVLRNPVKRKDLYFQSPEWINETLEELYRAGLVRITTGDDPENDKVEVAHEALVRNWPMLVGWIEQERVKMRQRRRLTSAAEQWLDHGRDEGALLGGTLLSEVAQYDDLNDLEKEFIKASQAFAEKIEKEKAEALELKNQLERDAFLALQQKNEAMAKNVRRLYFFIPVLIALLIIASGAAVYAFNQEKRAQESEKRAHASEGEAKTSEARAKDALAKVREEKEIAEGERTRAESKEKEAKKAEGEATVAKKAAEDEAIKARSAETLARDAEQRAIDEAKKRELISKQLQEYQERELKLRQLIEEAETELRVGEFDQAINKYAEALSSQYANDPSRRAKTLSRMAFIYRKLSIRLKRYGKETDSREASDTATKNYKDALDALNIRLEEAKKRNNQRELTSVLDQIAQVALENDDLKSAEEKYQEALRIQMDVLKQDRNAGDSTFDAIVEMLVDVYKKQPSKRTELESLYKAVLETKEQVFINRDPLKVYEASTELAEYYRLTYNYKNAEQYYQKAIEITAQHSQLNPSNLDIVQKMAESQYNLGVFYRSQGNLAQAATYLEQALNNLRSKIPQRNEDGKQLEYKTLLALAGVQKNLGKTEPAVKNFQEVAEMAGTTDIPVRTVAYVLNSVGEIYLATGNYDLAEKSYLAAKSTVEAAGSQEALDEHLRSLINLAKINYIRADRSKTGDASNYIKAGDQYLDAVMKVDSRGPVMVIKVSDRDRPKSDDLIFYENVLRFMVGKIEAGDTKLAREAETLIRDLESIYRNQKGKDERAVKGSGDNKLNSLYQQSVAIKIKLNGGTDNSVVWREYDRIGHLYQGYKDYRLAAAAFEKALEIGERLVIKEGNSLMFGSLSDLANIYVEQENYAVAEGYYIRAKETLEKSGEGKSEDMADLLEEYVELLRKMAGRAGQARQFENLINQIRGDKQQ